MTNHLSATPKSQPQFPKLYEAQRRLKYAERTPMANLMAGQFPDVGYAAGRLLTWAAWHSFQSGAFSLELGTIASQCNMPLRTTKAAVAELRGKGFLKLQGRVGANGPKCYLVRIPKPGPREVPDPKPSKPSVVLPERRSADSAPLYKRKTYPERQGGDRSVSKGVRTPAAATTLQLEVLQDLGRQLGREVPASLSRRQAGKLIEEWRATRDARRKAAKSRTSQKLPWWRVGAHPVGEPQMTEADRQEILRTLAARKRVKSLAELARPPAPPALKPLPIPSDPSVRIEGLARVRAAIFGTQTRG